MQSYSITTFQDHYYVCESIASAIEELRFVCQMMMIMTIVILMMLMTVMVLMLIIVRNNLKKFPVLRNQNMHKNWYILLMPFSNVNGAGGGVNDNSVVEDDGGGGRDDDVGVMMMMVVSL